MTPEESDARNRAALDAQIDRGASRSTDRPSVDELAAVDRRQEPPRPRRAEPRIIIRPGASPTIAGLFAAMNREADQRKYGRTRSVGDRLGFDAPTGQPTPKEPPSPAQAPAPPQLPPASASESTPRRISFLDKMRASIDAHPWLWGGGVLGALLALAAATARGKR